MSVGSELTEFIVLTSRVSGLIEWGPVLGQYSLLGTHNGAPCYRQSDTISSHAVYIYKDLETAWRVSRKLGELCEEQGLYNPNDSKLNTIPLTGWWFKQGAEWCNECSLQISMGPLATVAKIDLEHTLLTHKYELTYNLTDQWLCGRPVFRNRKSKHIYWSEGGWRCGDHPGERGKMMWKSSGNSPKPNVAWEMIKKKLVRKRSRYNSVFQDQ